MIENNVNYKEALELYDREFSHIDLISMLSSGSVIERQYAALNLAEINNRTEAKILLSNLVGVDGKIREVVAQKLVDFTKKYKQFFVDSENFEKFVQATIDIDGNVCRLAIISSYNLYEYKNFAKYYANGLIEIIETSLIEISKFTFRDKKYKINKQIFKIYWALEGLIYFHTEVTQQKLKNILKNCSQLEEYTIREKCAKMLNTLPLDNELEELKQRLMADENYYVRSILNN